MQIPEFQHTLKDDSDLILKLNSGDKEAFTRLYDKYVGMVYGYLFNFLKNEEMAEDLTQFCFMQIWINRQHVQPERNFPAYLYVIAKNAAYKEFRRSLKAENYINAAIVTENAQSPADYGSIDFKLIQKEVKRVISELPESRRKIYCMSRIEGMKPAEIAEKLKISRKTVDAQISRVNLSLRKAISRIIILACIAILTDGQSITGGEESLIYIAKERIILPFDKN